MNMNEQSVRQKITSLQIKIGDTVLVREHSRNDSRVPSEYIGKLISKSDDGILELLTTGKKVWNNEKNKRSVPYGEIEEILVVNK